MDTTLARQPDGTLQSLSLTRKALFYGCGAFLEWNTMNRKMSAAIPPETCTSAAAITPDRPHLITSLSRVTAQPVKRASLRNIQAAGLSNGQSGSEQQGLMMRSRT